MRLPVTPSPKNRPNQFPGKRLKHLERPMKDAAVDRCNRDYVPVDGSLGGGEFGYPTHHYRHRLANECDGYASQFLW